MFNSWEKEESGILAEGIQKEKENFGTMLIKILSQRCLWHAAISQTYCKKILLLFS